MSHHQEQSGEGLLIFAVGVLAAGVAWGATVLDHVPWLLPWAVIAIIGGLLAALVASAHGHLSSRVAIIIAVVGAVIAAVTWAGGYGPQLNRVHPRAAARPPRRRGRRLPTPAQPPPRPRSPPPPQTQPLPAPSRRKATTLACASRPRRRHGCMAPGSSAAGIGKRSSLAGRCSWARRWRC